MHLQVGGFEQPGQVRRRPSLRECGIGRPLALQNIQVRHACAVGTCSRRRTVGVERHPGRGESIDLPVAVEVEAGERALRRRAHVRVVQVVDAAIEVQVFLRMVGAAVVVEHDGAGSRAPGRRPLIARLEPCVAEAAEVAHVDDAVGVSAIRLRAPVGRREVRTRALLRVRDITRGVAAELDAAVAVRAHVVDVDERLRGAVDAEQRIERIEARGGAARGVACGAFEQTLPDLQRRQVRIERQQVADRRGDHRSGHGCAAL